MTDKAQEPKQKTPKGLEIPVPKRKDVNLNEFAWRYNHRGDRNTMFRDLLDAAARSRV